MKYTLRKGEKADLTDVVGLVKELAAYENAADKMVCSLKQYEQVFDEELIQLIIAADENENTVGMALYYMTFSTWRGKMMYLEDFYIQPDHRRTGLGQQIFERFLKESKEQNCTMVKWQVLDWNEPAISFYEKMDATIEREWWNGKIIF